MVKLREAAMVLLDDIDGLGYLERIGQINPIAIANLRAALKMKKPAPAGRRER